MYNECMLNVRCSSLQYFLSEVVNDKILFHIHKYFIIITLNFFDQKKITVWGQGE